MRIRFRIQLIYYRIRILFDADADPDADPGYQNDADPCVSGSKTLVLMRRDQILEVEEKLYLGTLGSLRVEDRQAWQAAIQTRQYTMGAEELTWGGDGEAKRLTQDMLTVSHPYPNYITFVIYTLIVDCSLTLI
jgi:hypothetical protein